MSQAMKKSIDDQPKHHRIIERKKMLQQTHSYWILRRAQDIFFSALALLVLWPVMLVVAIAVFVDDPHASPIFAQDRCGKDGRIFKMYKFRSMRKNAEAMLDDLMEQNEKKDGPAFKIKNDPRITRVGKFIRKTSLDELPQLWNILMGDMTIVGPRPPLPREVELYTDEERQRLYVTPGLTCYWQIKPNRDEISFFDWVELDLQYIDERSFFMDWKIILMTVKAVLFGQGQ